jgi:hypothetical protein
MKRFGHSTLNLMLLASIVTWIGSTIAIKAIMAPKFFPITKPAWFEDGSRMIPFTARMFAYDSCDCTQIFLSNGKNVLVKGNNCSLVTELMHYDDDQLDQLNKYFFSQFGYTATSKLHRDHPYDTISN